MEEVKTNYFIKPESSKLGYYITSINDRENIKHKKFERNYLGIEDGGVLLWKAPMVSFIEEVKAYLKGATIVNVFNDDEFYKSLDVYIVEYWDETPRLREDEKTIVLNVEDCVGMVLSPLSFYDLVIELELPEEEVAEAKTQVKEAKSRRRHRRK